MIHRRQGKKKSATENGIQQRVKHVERLCFILAACIFLQAIFCVGMVFSCKRLVRINAQYTEIASLLSERIDSTDSTVAIVLARLEEVNQLLKQGIL